MSFLSIPQTDICYPSNVSDIYLNRNVTDIYLNCNGIFFLSFIVAYCLFCLIFSSLSRLLFFHLFVSALSQHSLRALSVLFSLSTLVSEHTLSTLFDFILHYPRFPKGSLRLPNIVQRLHAVPRACKQFYKLAVP